MDRKTLDAYDSDAASFVRDWHEPPPPADLHALVRRKHAAQQVSARAAIRDEETA